MKTNTYLLMKTSSDSGFCLRFFRNERPECWPVISFPANTPGLNSFAIEAVSGDFDESYGWMSGGNGFFIIEFAPDGREIKREKLQGFEHARFGQHDDGRDNEWVGLSSILASSPHPFTPMLTLMGSEFCALCGRRDRRLEIHI